MIPPASPDQWVTRAVFPAPPHALTPTRRTPGSAAHRSSRASSSARPVKCATGSGGGTHRTATSAWPVAAPDPDPGPAAAGAGRAGTSIAAGNRDLGSASLAFPFGPSAHPSGLT